MVVSLNYCSQNGGNLYIAPYYNGNPNVGPRIIGNSDQYPYVDKLPMTRTLKTFEGLLGQFELHSRKLTWNPKKGPIKTGAIWISMLVWGSVYSLNS